MQRERALKEGFHIFITTFGEDMETAAILLEEAIREAEKEYEIFFLSGPSIKDDPSAPNVYLAMQGAVLTRKQSAGKAKT